MNIWIICIIVIVLVALSRLLSEKLYSSSESKTSSPQKQPEATSNHAMSRQSVAKPDLNEDDDEIIAVITAAAMSAFQGKQIVIRQISFITSRDESWARIGRLSNMSSHNIKIH